MIFKKIYAISLEDMGYSTISPHVNSLKIFFRAGTSLDIIGNPYNEYSNILFGAQYKGLRICVNDLFTGKYDNTPICASFVTHR